MAGLFQVLWGTADGTFKKAEPLRGDDGELLLVSTRRTDDPVLDRICTRAFAVDLDGDGKLDLVSGNFGGTFAMFQGLGGGKFAAKNTWLEHAGEPLTVQMHSDPFFVDWDGDGDLDLISGSARGGVFLFTNEGDRKAPRFGARQTLVAAEELPSGTAPIQFGETHIDRPGSDTRVWVEDADGDGKLDLLIGDQVTIAHPAEGLTEAQTRERMVAWEARQKQLSEKQDAGQDDWQALWQEREKIIADKATGFVWLLRRK